MQFTSTMFALVGALAASASAQYGSNGTWPAAPTGTGISHGHGGAGGYPGHGGNGTAPSRPSSTGYTPPTQWGNGAAGLYASSGLGLLVVGGVALAL